MDSRQWNDKLRRDLQKQRLPLAYIDRLIGELSDHLIDSQTENPSMDAQVALDRIGSADKIAAAASSQFRRRTFTGRHPWFTFVVGPFLIAPLAFLFFALSLAFVLSVVGIAAELAGRQITDNPLEDSIVLAIAQAFNLLARFVPFIIAAWFFCRLAKRNGRDHWAISACVILALLSGLVVSEITPGTHKYYPNSWLVGLAYPRCFRPSLSYLNQVLQILAPLAVATWFLIRPRQTISPANTAAI
jgi:hypothetical protein